MIVLEQHLDCVVHGDQPGARPIHLVRSTAIEAFLASLPPQAAGFLRDQSFTGAAGKLYLLPGASGVAGAVLGLGDAPETGTYGGLAASLPPGVWRFADQIDDTPVDDTPVLGFCLGAYQTRPTETPRAQLAVGDGHQAALAMAGTIFMVRDLINLPPNRLGPVELADAVAALGTAFGARTAVCTGDALEAAFPTVAAVGAGSVRPAQVASLRWQGTSAPAGAPLIALCGKGVVFDTGGYDLKTSSSMLHMKKDMGGSAVAMGLARLIMQADLPVRLALWVGCVENSVSGHAMRPSDVINTRAGISVEVGNTDAEGRLVLCDLLAAACDESPDLVLDFATLTGAARVALGPDLPALFCNDDAWANHFIQAGTQVFDPLWRLPLWQGYRDWLKSNVADMGNVSSKSTAGAIVAALYLQQFVKPGTRWAHFDCYCWNDIARPGRPEGGEATGLQGVFEALRAAITDYSSTETYFSKL